LCPGGRGDAPREPLRPFQQCGAAKQQQDIPLLPQHARRLADGVRIGLRRRRHGQGRGDNAALVPRGVGGQDQGGDLPRPCARRLHRHGRVGAHLLGPGGGPDPGGDAARPAFRIGRQGRIERPVISGLVADHVDDAAAGAAGVVQVGEAIGETRAAMQ
jgi:hypothetical protein